MGLIGPNGAGKTTIIKLILNLIRRDGGEIRILGLDNSAGEAARKIRVGFVHDTPCFYEHLTLANDPENRRPVLSRLGRRPVSPA